MRINPFKRYKRINRKTWEQYYEVKNKKDKDYIDKLFITMVRYKVKKGQEA